MLLSKIAAVKTPVKVKYLPEVMEPENREETYPPRAYAACKNKPALSASFKIVPAEKMEPVETMEAIRK